MLRSRGAIDVAISAAAAVVVVVGVAAGAAAVPSGAAEDRSAACAAQRARPEAARPPANPQPVTIPPTARTWPGRDVTGAGGSLTQTIQLTVIGGTLRLPDDRPRLDLVPAGPGRLVGALAPVEVVDARGTHEGWELRWSVDEAWMATAVGPVLLTPQRVMIEPATPEAVHGEPFGLYAGPTCPGSGLLAHAEPGGGAGIYAVGATVTLEVPRGLEALGGSVVLGLTVG
jgi:hypothetical protein